MKNTQIPKIIHYCWFGRNPLPPMAVKCIDSWKKYLPDYEIKEWQNGGRPFIRVNAPQKVSGEFAYAMLPDGTATITKVLTDRKIVALPSEVDGVTVSQVGRRASKDFSFGTPIAYDHPMEKFVVPDTVTYLGSYIISGA